MCDALSVVPGVEHVALELDGRGRGVLRIRLAAGADGDEVVGAAVAGLRRRFGPGVDASRLRLTGPRGCPVVAVMDDALARPAAGDDEAPPVRTASRIGPQSTVPTPSRVAVEDVEVVTELLQVRANVRLRSGGTLHTG